MSLAYTLTEKVVEPVTSCLLAVGINSAFKAGVVVSILAAGTYWLVRPSSAFDPNTGEPRPWSMLECPEGKNSPVPTPIPWYVGSALIGYTVNLIV